MFKALLSVRIRSIMMGFLSGVRGKKGVSKGSVVLYALLFGFLGLMGLILFSAVFLAMAPLFHEMGIDWVYFSLYALIAFVLMFIGSVFTAKSQLFDAKDNELLLSLPISVQKILMSRMVSLVITNFVYCALVALPAAIMWAVLCRFTALGAIAFVLITLALPLFSTAVSALFGWLLALLAKKIPGKTLFSTLFSILFLVVYFWASQHMSDGIMLMASNGEKIAGAFSGIAPIVWIGSAIADGNLLHMLYVLLLLTLPLAAALWLLSRSFHKLTGIGAGGKKKVYRHSGQRASGIDRALYTREARRLFSSSAYMVNAGMGAVLELGLCVLLIIRWEDAAGLLDQAMLVPGLSGYVLAAVALLLCLMSGMVYFSAPSVSIDGKTVWILRASPVPEKKILAAKLRLHMSIAMPAMLPLQVALAWLLQPDWVGLVGLLLLPQAFNFFIGALGLAANLMRPRLDWMNEAQAVKNSTSVVIAMFGGWGAVLAVGALGFLLGQVLPGNWMVPAMSCVTLAAAWLLYRWIMTRGAKIYSTL